MALGERIVYLRMKKKMKGYELAKVIGVAGNTLSNYELNRREPSIGTLIIIADFFNVSVDYLLGRTDSQNPNNDKMFPNKDVELEELAINYNLFVDGNELNEEEKIGSLTWIKVNREVKKRMADAVNQLNA